MKNRSCLLRTTNAGLGFLGGILLTSFVLLLLPLLLVPESSSGWGASDQLKAYSDARTSVIGFLLAVIAAVTLWFTGRTYRLNAEGHVTDRYIRAVAQLGDTSPTVRVGGVYALERIGHDSAKDRVSVIRVLGAFIREQSHVERSGERSGDPLEDVQAGLRVAGRLLMKSVTMKLDLRGSDLRKADLSKLPKDRVLLDGAKMEDTIPPAA